MLCFQSLLGLGMSGICIQPRIIGNVFFHIYKRVLFLLRFLRYLTF